MEAAFVIFMLGSIGAGWLLRGAWDRLRQSSTQAPQISVSTPARLESKPPAELYSWPENK